MESSWGMTVRAKVGLLDPKNSNFTGLAICAPGSLLYICPDEFADAALFIRSHTRARARGNDTSARGRLVQPSGQVVWGICTTTCPSTAEAIETNATAGGSRFAEGNGTNATARAIGAAAAKCQGNILPDYASKTLQASVCLPDEKRLRNMFLAYLDDEGAWSRQLMMVFLADFACWISNHAWIILLCVTLSTWLAHKYVQLLVVHFDRVVQASTGICVVVFAPLGFMFTWHAKSAIGMGLGVLSLCVGVGAAVGVLFFWNCNPDVFEVAPHNLRAAFECFQDMPNLWSLGTIFAILQFPFAATMVCGFLSHCVILKFLLAELPDPDAIEMTSSPFWRQLGMLVVDIFLSLWLAIAFAKLQGFTIAYCVQEWYQTRFIKPSRGFFALFHVHAGDEQTQELPTRTLCAAFRTALWYHMGTILLSSLVLLVSWIARCIFGPVLFLFCRGCSDSWFMFNRATSWAVMQVALEGDNLQLAIAHVREVLDYHIASADLLVGGLWIPLFLGVLSVSAVCAVVGLPLADTASTPVGANSTTFLSANLEALDLLILFCIMSAASAVLIVIKVVSDALLFCISQTEEAEYGSFAGEGGGGSGKPRERCCEIHRFMPHQPPVQPPTGHTACRSLRIPHPFPATFEMLVHVTRTAKGRVSNSAATSLGAARRASTMRAIPD